MCPGLDQWEAPARVSAFQLLPLPSRESGLGVRGARLRNCNCESTPGPQQDVGTSSTMQRDPPQPPLLNRQFRKFVLYWGYGKYRALSARDGLVAWCTGVADTISASCVPILKGLCSAAPYELAVGAANGGVPLRTPLVPLHPPGLRAGALQPRPHTFAAAKHLIGPYPRSSAMQTVQVCVSREDFHAASSVSFDVLAFCAATRAMTWRAPFLVIR